MFFTIGSGRVLEKIPGSGSGSSRVGVLQYMIGYFRVSFLLSGISGYFWVYWITSLFFGGNNFQINITVGQIQGKWCKK